MKLAIEKYLGLFKLLHGLDFLVLRPSNPFGTRQRAGAQGAIAAFMHKMLRAEPIDIWGDGSVVRDYVCIGNAVDAMIKGMEYAGEQRVFNVGSGEGRSLNDVLQVLEAVAGRKALRNYLPARAVDVPKNVLDISLIARETGWTPGTSFADGVDQTWNWYQKRLGDPARFA